MMYYRKAVMLRAAVEEGLIAPAVLEPGSNGSNGSTGSNGSPFSKEARNRGRAGERGC
jgi:hypothetical protein